MGAIYAVFSRKCTLLTYLHKLYEGIYYILLENTINDNQHFIRTGFQKSELIRIPRI